MRTIFKGLLTLDAISLLLVIYLIKSCIWIPQLRGFSVIVYLLAPLIIAYICIVLSGWLSQDSIEGGISGVELANDSFLPSYAGYFFVALSVPDKQYLTLLVVFGILFVFLFCSQNLYYNPLFLIFGYRFYNLINEKNMRIFLITRRDIKSTKDLRFQDLRRINYFTFIDREKP